MSMISFLKTPQSGGGGRKEFIRTRVSRAEKVASWSIVFLIACFGVAIAIKGKRYDPSLYALNPEALQSTKNEVQGKAGTIKVGNESSEVNPSSDASGGYESALSAPASEIPKEPIEIDVPGLKPMGPTEFYGADNLYEKINGRAPAYMSFGFQQLRARSFEVEKVKGAFVDVYEYLMDSPVNAFGIFAVERDPKGNLMDGVVDGYSGEMGCFFRQGARYVQVIGSDQKNETVQMMRAVALNRVQKLPADDRGLDARRRLPADGMIAESVQYLPENAQGQALLKETFQADYLVDGKKATFFVMVTTSDKASEAWFSFQKFAAQMGSVKVLPDIANAKVFQTDIFGKTKIIYQREGELGGLVDLKDVPAGMRFLEKHLAPKSVKE